jgi:hypothetical protein
VTSAISGISGINEGETALFMWSLNWGSGDEEFKVQRVTGGWILQVKTGGDDSRVVFTDRAELAKTIEYLIGLRRAD